VSGVEEGVCERIGQLGGGLVLRTIAAHLSHKNKDVAKVGHPGSC